MTYERLHQLLIYSPTTGLFHWRVSRGCVKAGSVAGTLNDGYIEIRLDGVRYGAHRLAWLYMTGRWPDPEVDHKNTQRADNRWENLREATRQQNMCNLSGVVGAYRKSNCDRWQAQIRLDGKQTYLGLFETKEDAMAAYAQAAAERNTHRA